MIRTMFVLVVKVTISLPPNFRLKGRTPIDATLLLTEEHKSKISQPDGAAPNDNNALLEINGAKEDEMPACQIHVLKNDGKILVKLMLLAIRPGG